MTCGGVPIGGCEGVDSGGDGSVGDDPPQPAPIPTTAINTESPPRRFHLVHTADTILQLMSWSSIDQRANWPGFFYLIMCLSERSFSRQISSINSASAIKRSLIVTVHGFV